MVISDGSMSKRPSCTALKFFGLVSFDLHTLFTVSVAVFDDIFLRLTALQSRSTYSAMIKYQADGGQPKPSGISSTHVAGRDLGTGNPCGGVSRQKKAIGAERTQGYGEVVCRYSSIY